MRMTPQEIERNIEFIIEQQAKFSADNERINATLDKHNEAIVGLLQVSRTLIDHANATNAQIAELREEIARMQKANEERSRQTDERLNVLINVVEKHITGPDHGGRPA
jgi:hypothetical protein